MIQEVKSFFFFVVVVVGVVLLNVERVDAMKGALIIKVKFVGVEQVPANSRLQTKAIVSGDMLIVATFYVHHKCFLSMHKLTIQKVGSLLTLLLLLLIKWYLMLK